MAIMRYPPGEDSFRHKAPIALFIVVLTLFAMGLLMVFNTTSAEMLDKGQSLQLHAALLKQALSSILGAVIGCGIYWMGYKKFLQITPWLFCIGVVGLILVFFPKIGRQINGSYRWIQILGVSLQPSELMKFIIPLFMVHRMFHVGFPKTFWEFCRMQCIFLFPIVLILLEPDNGSAAIILATLGVSYFIFSIRWQYWLIPLLIVGFFGGVAALKMKHIPDRIRIYLHPETDLLGKGHQPYQAKIATGSGGLYGRGFGESMQKRNYLPEARSDYIAAIFAEEMGFIGVCCLLILFMLIGAIGFRIACTAADLHGYYSAVILTFLITLQAFVNLGVVSGLLPSKGISLPFFSQGGSSLTASSIIVALLLSIGGKNREAACRHLP